MTEKQKKEMYEASKSLADEYENDSESENFTGFLKRKMSKEDFIKKMREDFAC